MADTSVRRMEHHDIYSRHETPKSHPAFTGNTLRRDSDAGGVIYLGKAYRTIRIPEDKGSVLHCDSI